MTTDEPELRAALTDLLDDYLSRNGPDGYPQPMPASWRVVQDWLATTPAASDAESPVGSLDVAWREAEEALPEGWLELRLTKRAKSEIGPYHASVHDGSQGAMAIRTGLAVAHASKPAIALRRLAARLTELEQDG